MNNQVMWYAARSAGVGGVRDGGNDVAVDRDAPVPMAHR
jgi:hypothetical protein